MTASEIIKLAGFESLKSFSEYSEISDRKLSRMFKTQNTIFIAVVKQYAAQRLTDLIGQPMQGGLHLLHFLKLRACNTHDHSYLIRCVQYRWVWSYINQTDISLPLMLDSLLSTDVAPLIPIICGQPINFEGFYLSCHYPQNTSFYLLSIFY